MARHIYHCPLRWSDMDAFGHVNNVVFVRYLEEARIDFMFRLARADGSPSFSGGSVVARHEIDYLKPLFHRHEPVVIETWVTQITAATVTLTYEIKDGEAPGAALDGDAGTRSGSGTLYARASTVVVPYDLTAQRPRRLTAEERAFLERFRDDDGPSGPGSGARQGSTTTVQRGRSPQSGALVT
ncbi:acyl-CoA thioesterase [Streptomyces odontomachi]|uniref:acyl-CoA thioesterase n=1 Tax=Streptomyces odontomachi TaxID=2944940 RepID=UPI00210B006E|nr:thioesterase family protein [Streptomyces sp. ODS25]